MNISNHSIKSTKYKYIPDNNQTKSNLNQPYKTPIKQNIIYPPNNIINQNSTPDKINYIFGNINENLNIKYENIQNNESNFLFKSTLEKSNLKITNSEFNIKTNSFLKLNKINYDADSCSNKSGEYTKKNLCEIFNNAKNNNDFFNLSTEKKISPINKENILIKNNFHLKKFIFTSPNVITKSKKIFECSASTLETESKLNHLKKKKRRFRKNQNQLKSLINFYRQNKQWNKNQIKKISEEIGLKENKVYKWLWDQRNKELKNAKFIVTNNKINSKKE